MDHSESKGGLSGMFNKAVMYSHYLMYFTMGSMALAALGGLWSSGVPVGVFDGVGMFLQSYLPSWGTLSQAGDGINAIFNSAVHGEYITENFWTNPHEIMHAGHAAAPSGVPEMSDTAKQILGM